MLLHGEDGYVGCLLSNRSKILLRAALAALGLASTASHAIVYHIDFFNEGTAAGTFFSDSFSDGVPPPSAPNFANGNPAAYFVFGAYAPTAETGGKLAIDTSLGILNAPFGVPVQTVNTGLLTGTFLSQSLGFFVQGRFDLSQLPLNPNEYVGLRVGDDNALGNRNGVVELVLRMHMDHQLYIDVRELDFTAPSATVVFSLAVGGLLASLPTADQIDFTLGHAPGATQLGAAFALLSGGSVLTSALLPVTAGNLFDGETSVLGGFVGVGVAAIPEPSTLLLVGFSLAGIAFTRLTKTRARA